MTELMQLVEKQIIYLQSKINEKRHEIGELDKKLACCNAEISTLGRGIDALYEIRNYVEKVDL